MQILLDLKIPIAFGSVQKNGLKLPLPQGTLSSLTPHLRSGQVCG